LIESLRWLVNRIPSIIRQYFQDQVTVGPHNVDLEGGVTLQRVKVRELPKDVCLQTVQKLQES
jgi:hypothetical protein